MGKIELHPDFKDFLKYLNSQKVEYLLIGGYAVGYHGYPRATGDMDIWIAADEKNASKVVTVLQNFGMPEAQLTKELFLENNKVIRMGVPPVRIEVITGISGVNFQDCYSRRESIEIDNVLINVISLDDLKINKKASGRYNQQHIADKGVITAIIGNILLFISLHLTCHLIGNILLINTMNRG